VEFSARQTGSPKDFLTRIYRFVVSQGVNTNMATYQDRHIKTRSPRGVGPYECSKFRWPRITLNHKTEPDEVNGLPEASRTMNMFGVEQGFSCASSVMNVKQNELPGLRSRHDSEPDS
jgi:hypothetical protein